MTLASSFILAQAADVLTFVRFQALDASPIVSKELNPLIGAVQPAISIALKVGLILFVLAVVEISRRAERPVIGRVVLVVGIIAGLVGTLSNLAPPLG